ncbi:MAG: hypothetical protein ACRDP1_02790 [Nocardioidaceae bacterium]
MDDVAGPLSDQQRMLDGLGGASEDAELPVANLMAVAVGQWSRSRPQRSATPATSGTSSRRPVVTRIRRAASADPSANGTSKPKLSWGRTEVTVPRTR